MTPVMKRIDNEAFFLFDNEASFCQLFSTPFTPLPLPLDNLVDTFEFKFSDFVNFLEI